MKRACLWLLSVVFAVRLFVPTVNCITDEAGESSPKTTVEDVLSEIHDVDEENVGDDEEGEEEEFNPMGLQIWDGKKLYYFNKCMYCIDLI